MDARFKYTSMAAAAIATELGFMENSERVKKLCYAMYEAALKCEPTKCPTAWAEGAVTINRVRPKAKAKKE